MKRTGFFLELDFSHHLVSDPFPKPPKPYFWWSLTGGSTVIVFVSSFDWFTGLPVSFVIGQGDYFGFGFMTLA